jgi:hypothetical protein
MVALATSESPRALLCAGPNSVCVSGGPFCSGGGSGLQILVDGRPVDEERCSSCNALPCRTLPAGLGVTVVDPRGHSTTKYIGGHSDVIGGAFITKYDITCSNYAATCKAMEVLCHPHSTAG